MRKIECAQIVQGILGAWLTLNAATILADDWPQFRGAASLGVAPDNPALPDRWSASDNVAWKTPIPGLGWSSPIIAGDKIFLTTVVNDGETEPPKKGLYFGGERTTPPDSVHRWMVYCVDLKSGKILWEKTAHQGKPESSRHLKNTFASETPVTDGQRVYAYFGNVGLFAYDMDGKELWNKKWEVLPTRFGWGTAASPALDGDRLYIVNDNDKASFLVALDKTTGKEIWRTDRKDEHTNWATPYIWKNEKRAEIVTAGTQKVRSYDMEGKLLWQFGGMSKIAIPTPFSSFGLLYICSGYVGDKIRPVYAIRPGASGDISLKGNETSNQYIAWYQDQAGPYNPSPIIYGDFLYVLLDRGFFACYDAKTGKEIYGKQRIDKDASEFTSSPWAYNGKIFCLSEDGDAFVIQAGSEFKVLGKNSVGEMCMATPAVAGSNLVLRSASNLYRVGGK